jgi:hypothetical protein
MNFTRRRPAEGRSFLVADMNTIPAAVSSGAAGRPPNAQSSLTCRARSFDRSTLPPYAVPAPHRCLWRSASVLGTVTLDGAPDVGQELGARALEPSRSYHLTAAVPTASHNTKPVPAASVLTRRRPDCSELAPARTRSPPTAV